MTRSTGRLQASHSASRLSRPVFFLLIATIVIAFVGLWALRDAPPLTRHMSLHILAMNAIAPLLALAAFHARLGIANSVGTGRFLLGSSTLQITVLWLVHTPGWIALSLPSVELHAATQFALLGAAFLFWLSVFSQRGAGRASALLALLVAGKLFCLLGALLVFSPRAVYAESIWQICAPGTAPAQLVADQHLAGLLMLTACPLSYVLAGVVISALWLRELSAASGGRAA